jgi:hypothetical protein
MEAVLVKNEMWGYVNGSIEKPNNEENTIWEENDKKARADLILAINPNELRQIKNCVTSNGIWKKLKELYESKGPARKATLLKQLIMSKMNEGETMKNHLNNFFNIIDKLEERELKIVDDLVTILLLYSIPDSYENFRIAIESRDELPKPETLKIKLTEEYEARKSRENQNSPGALLIKKCYKKEDGPKSSKENLRKNNFKEAFKFKCHYCKKIGHKAENCWSKAKARNEISKKAEVTVTVLEINRTKSESQWWCVDSGASSHMCSSKDQFQNIAQNDQVLNLANHSFTKIRGTGNVKIKVSNENNLRSVNLNNVMYVPDLRSNLLSVGKITDKGSTVIFENNKVYILDKDGKEIMIGQKRNHLYYVREILDKKGETAAASMNISRTKIQEWHEKFGHINEQQLKELARSNEVYGLNIGCNEHLINCSICLKAKQTRKSFSRNESHKKETLLELIHTDICGPMRVNSIGGSRYFITFIDDKSGWCEIYFIKKKSEAASAFFKYKAMVENQLGKRIKCLRSDNGTEYLCNELESYLEKHGIKHEMTVAYTPEQNGVAERRNRTLVEMARCMMIQSQLSSSFWAEAISTANYLRNRCPSRSINGQTPHKLWTGKDFSVKHFQIFGTKGYRLDKTPNKGKFDPRSKKCIFVGYSTERRAYRVWCPDFKRIYATRDVKFVNNLEVKEQPMQEEFTSEDIMEKEKEEMTRCPYQNLIGSLMYLSVSTRPHISYAVSCLSQYNTCFGKEHWTAAKRVLRYLKGTRDYGLVYEKNVEDIIGFADADWGANPDDRKSYTGYIFIFANCSVSWEARKQQTVALSSTEAEYMALSDATKEAIYLRRFLKEVLNIDKQIQIMNDNQGARSLAQNPIQHSRTKHIDIRHHFIREILQRKEIEIKYIQTSEMVADFLTKPLSKFKHNYCLENSGIKNIE